MGVVYDGASMEQAKKTLRAILDEEHGREPLTDGSKRCVPPVEDSYAMLARTMERLTRGFEGTDSLDLLVAALMMVHEDLAQINRNLVSSERNRRYESYL